MDERLTCLAFKVAFSLSHANMFSSHTTVHSCTSRRARYPFGIHGFPSVALADAQSHRCDLVLNPVSNRMWTPGWKLCVWPLQVYCYAFLLLKFSQNKKKCHFPVPIFHSGWIYECKYDCGILRSFAKWRLWWAYVCVCVCLLKGEEIWGVGWRWWVAVCVKARFGMCRPRYLFGHHENRAVLVVW